MSKRQNFSVNTRKILRKQTVKITLSLMICYQILTPKTTTNKSAHNPPTTAAHVQQWKVDVRADSINNSEERCATKRSEFLVIATATF